MLALRVLTNWGTSKLRVSDTPKRPKDSPEDIPDPPKQIPGPLGGFVGFQGLSFRVQGWGANLGFWI